MNNQKRVQKKNKKANLSGFILFVIEFNGRSVKDGEDTFVQGREINKAKPSWNRLSFAEQEKYKTRAKEKKAKIINTTQRFNSLGENLDDVEERSRKQEEAKNNRRCEIEHMLKDASEMSELDGHVFYLVSASKFYDDSNGIYPAEFAIAKFSLAEGVIDTLSFKINPGELPLGSALSVQEHAAATHKYKIDDADDHGEKCYIEILSKIVNFLHPFDDIPVFFTEGNDEIPADIKPLRDTQRIMRLIFEEAGEYQLASVLKVYSIDELLYYLKKITVQIGKEANPESNEMPFSSIVIANQYFKKGSIEYSYRARGCKHHTRVDALPHCCLSKVLCYGYTLAKWCSASDKYELKPGQHFPKSLQLGELHAR